MIVIAPGGSARVKPEIVLIALTVALSGCDDPKGPIAYTPEMASFSNEFDFDPLRGPVKDFSQTLMNDKGEVTRRVSATVSHEGCFDSLEFHDLDANTSVALVLDANYYLGAQALDKRIKLQGKCQLAELPAIGLLYDTDDNGFVVAARGKETTVNYRYDEEGYPLGKKTQTKDSTLDVKAITGKDKRKKLDYQSVSMLDNKTISRARQTCKYDKYFNPVSCTLDITDESVAPAAVHHYTIQNTIDYY